MEWVIAYAIGACGFLVLLGCGIERGEDRPELGRIVIMTAIWPVPMLIALGMTIASYRKPK